MAAGVDARAAAAAALAESRRGDGGDRADVAAAGVLPRALMQTLLVVALALLLASMGCAWWLWRRRHAATDGRRGPLPRGIATALTVLAVLLVWVALVAPDQPSRFTLDAFVRLPVELLVVAAVAAVAPATPRRVLAVVVGAVLGALVLVKVLNMGFYTAFDRPSSPSTTPVTWGSASRRCATRSAGRARTSPSRSRWCSSSRSSPSRS